MTYKLHDTASNKGFYVDLEVLAHDLTILKLSKSNKITSKSNENEIYDAYITQLKEFRDLIDDKTRYDSTISLEHRIKKAFNDD